MKEGKQKGSYTSAKYTHTQKERGKPPNSLDKHLLIGRTSAIVPTELLRLVNKADVQRIFKLSRFQHSSL